MVGGLLVIPQVPLQTSPLISGIGTACPGECPSLELSREWTWHSVLWSA